MTDDLIGKLMALSCAVLWAFAVILFKRSGETMSPLALNLYKSIVSMLLFFPCFWLMDDTLMPSHATLSDYWILFLSGFIGITVSDSMFFKSLNLIGAGLSAIVDCLYSPMVILLSFVVLKKNVTTRDYIGAILIISAVLIASLKFDKGSPGPPRAIVMGLILGAAAMFSVALGVILLEPILSRHTALWVTQVRLIFGSITLALYALAMKDRKTLFEPFRRAHTWRFAFPATVLGSFLAMILWIGAFEFTSIISASILNQTSTIFIVILATVFLKETFTLRRLAAVVLAMIGSLIVITA